MKGKANSWITLETGNVNCVIWIILTALYCRYKYCVRATGGANAGHTVVIKGQKFDFHLVPCGVVHENCRCLIGNGCVVHIPTLLSEIDKLIGQGVTNVKYVSDPVNGKEGRP